MAIAKITHTHAHAQQINCSICNMQEQTDAKLQNWAELVHKLTSKIHNGFISHSTEGVRSETNL